MKATDDDSSYEAESKKIKYLIEKAQINSNVLKPL